MSARPPYAAESRQLTVRAVAVGMVIGAVLCAANVYVVLKTGWSLGVTLSSTIIAFGLFRALGAAGLVRRPLGALENTTVSSVASAAAFMTGGGNMAALPALVMLTGQRPGAAVLALWFFVLAALGVVTAIPIRRQLLDVERLPFPLGVATANTLRAMHGTQERAGPAAKLFGAAGIAALFAVLRDVRALPARLPSTIAVPLSLSGHPLKAWSLGVDASLVLVGGGALMGPRTAWSMAAGALLTYGVLAPAMIARRIIPAVDYNAIVAFTAWPGAALLVSSAVFSLSLDGRRIARGVAALAVRVRPPSSAPVHDGETEHAPMRWFVVGVAALGPVAVLLMTRFFGIPIWAGLLAIPLALLMGVVSGRVTGETDMSPTKALGPVTQLLFAGLLPANLTANLMSANVTGGVALHAGDLLTDLKAGQLVGASPRLQIVAQLFGVAIGSLAVVPVFTLLVPDPSALGSADLPAPAVLVWAQVSRALAQGVAGIPAPARVAAVVGAVIGMVLAGLERALPVRARAWLPSAAGLGMACLIPGATALAMFAGSVFGSLVRRLRPGAAHVITPVASGLVAGESVLGVAIALARAFGAPV